MCPLATGGFALTTEYYFLARCLQLTRDSWFTHSLLMIYSLASCGLLGPGDVLTRHWGGLHLPLSVSSLAAHGLLVTCGLLARYSWFTQP